MRLDINYFRAKYDFDIAEKLSGRKPATSNPDVFEDFKHKATDELLNRISEVLGNTTFSSLFTFDGQPIASLDQIPADCQLLLVSAEDKPKGLLNNLFDFKSQQDKLRHSMQVREEAMTRKKD